MHSKDQGTLPDSPDRFSFSEALQSPWLSVLDIFGPLCLQIPSSTGILRQRPDPVKPSIGSGNVSMYITFALMPLGGANFSFKKLNCDEPEGEKP